MVSIDGLDYKNGTTDLIYYATQGRQYTNPTAKACARAIQYVQYAGRRGELALSLRPHYEYM